MLVSLHDKGGPWHDTRWTKTPSTTRQTEEGEHLI